ncbi:uncharacterized protein METZ01_LOCUS343035 [marine metagenome]|uniref:Uncharacterized protein n=1 Tax=marine metagenome TaxID=408172 RepID=A0A382R0Q9_9ZZZZ
MRRSAFIRLITWSQGTIGPDGFGIVAVSTRKGYCGQESRRGRIIASGKGLTIIQ